MGLRHRASRLFADGLDTTAYVERIEREFYIRIPDEDGAGIDTLGQLCNFVTSKCGSQALDAADDWIWLTLRRITSDEFGVMESDLHKETRFAEDLMC